MSTHASDDLDRLGYFLPEDSQQRLKRLCENLRFLVQLAQPRTRDEELDREPDVYMGDVAMCLTLRSSRGRYLVPGFLQTGVDDDERFLGDGGLRDRAGGMRRWPGSRWRGRGTCANARNRGAAIGNPANAGAGGVA